MFDGYDFDEEECSLVKTHLNEIIVQDDEDVINKENFDCDARRQVQKYSKISSGNLIGFFKDVAATKGGATVTTDGDIVANSGQPVSLDDPKISQVSLGGLDFSDHITISLSNLQFENMEKNKILIVRDYTKKDEDPCEQKIILKSQIVGFNRKIHCDKFMASQDKLKIQREKSTENSISHLPISHFISSGPYGKGDGVD
ncbi:hypothetical protein Hanom_Chr12g01155251 [Helianthus anomalus]